MTNVGEATRPEAAGAVVVLHADEIEQVPWLDVPAWDGAVERILWRDTGTGSCSGVLSLAPAASHVRHAHHEAAHHMWILSGSLRVGDEMVGRGSYVYIARGAGHGPHVAGSEGCTLFYVYDAD